MCDQTTMASDVCRLETDQPGTFGGTWLFHALPFWRPDWGHAGVSIVRKTDGKIVGIINDEMYDSLSVKAQLEADLEALTAFEFAQTWGVNTAR
jgi:hypothetical protein